MKRKSDQDKSNKKKRFKNTGKLLDPNTSGIYATCNRNKETQCRNELINLFNENVPDTVEEEDEETKELSIEDKIKLEVAELKQTKSDKFKPLELDCECLIFIKLPKSINPVDLVDKICQASYESKIKTTRYTQKLSPVVDSCSASREELKNLTKRILQPIFHNENQEPIKFAIQISKRNFNSLTKDEMIKTIAECIGHDHGHKVDLKNYDKLIIVECYKNNIGMSVVENYLKYSKFNLQQIFDKQQSDSS
ncbi:tRNA acetyltransferase TAN1 [Spathaspora sp. JA1]|nr:tRNA acetyltransferase TAN1 [Spathaspora sp. JA1]